MRVKRTIVIALAGVLALGAVTGCGSNNSGGSKKSGATVLNIGMPNGTQTENNNPFLGSSAGASLGYRYLIYAPLVMTNAARLAEPGKAWLATKWEWAD